MTPEQVMELLALIADLRLENKNLRTAAQHLQRQVKEFEEAAKQKETIEQV